MIAVVTTSKAEFDYYVASMGLSKKEAKQVKVLSDIQGFVFSSMIEIQGSNNVTDHIINNILVK